MGTECPKYTFTEEFAGTTYPNKELPGIEVDDALNVKLPVSFVLDTPAFGT